MLNKILEDLKPFNASLVAVSKTMEEHAIMEVYNKGHKIFGENRAMELAQKQKLLPQDIQWHMIGHLQTNKVKYIAPFVYSIDSVDSLKLLNTINKEAAKNNRKIKILLQFRIAEEDTKYGLTLDEAVNIIQSADASHIIYSGVMGMGTFTDDKVQLRKEFRKLKSIFEKLKRDVFSENENFNDISMGMSGDYLLALEEGSTMVRIGSLIFGPRY